MAKKKDPEVEEARRELRKMLPPGSTVYGVVRHVSRSGMERRIDFYAIRRGYGRGSDKYGLAFLTGRMARLLGYRHPSSGPSGMVVGGCGTDMIFHCVHSLSYALHGHAVKGEAADAERKGVPFHKTRPGHYRPGYSLTSEPI